MNIKGLAVLHVSAEGHHSGKYASCAVIVEQEFLAMILSNKELLGRVYFSELDGKHSETKGDFEYIIVEEQPQESFKVILESNKDEYLIWDELFGEFNQELIKEQIEVHKRISKKITSNTVVKYYFDGKEV